MILVVRDRSEVSDIYPTKGLIIISVIERPDTLKGVRHKSPRPPVIMPTAYGTIRNAVDVMKLGAYDFIVKTVDLQGIDQVVDRALEFRTLRQKIDLRELSLFLYSTRAASLISSLG